MTANRFERLERRINSVGLRRNVERVYTDYVRALKPAGVPPIFSFLHLCSLLGREPYYLASAINAPEHHYRTFQIPKRSGGRRKITAPYPALLDCQRWMLSNVLSKVDVHVSCHGFVKGRSIITNAKVHAGQSMVLKTDLTDFFPSISIDRVISVFQRLGYPTTIAFYLAAICTFQKSLPQGAATSPALSNIISYRMDKRLYALAKSKKCKYSRYADDITFSGNVIKPRLLASLSKIIESEGFQLNPKKTRLYRPEQRKLITGIDASRKIIRPPRRFRREVRKDVHFVRKFGTLSHLSRLRIRDPLYLYRLAGKLEFWRQIEPENGYILETIDWISGLREEIDYAGA